MRKRFAAMLLAAAMAAGLLSLAACSSGGGKKTTAAAMHLRRIEGTVSVSDGDGKEVLPRRNLGLYSGYGVGTGAASYAWIDLDDVKLAKLDQNSEIAIEKKGKALDIQIRSGSLFFNVTEPLGDDETMNIRTSTLLVGIRGTSGWVEANGGLSRVYILEGRVECSAGEQTVLVNAGQMAELRSDGELTVKEFPEQDTPAFVRVELESGGPDDTPGPDNSKAPESSEPQNTGSGDGQANDGLDNGDGVLKALQSAQSGNVIKLAGDVDMEMAGHVEVTGGTAADPVVLDLNGHTLTLIGGAPQLRISGALEIRDSSGTGSGALEVDGIINIYVRDSGYLYVSGGSIRTYISADTGTTVVMDGGTVSNFNSSNSGGALYIHSAFIMNGGTVYGEVVVYPEAFFTLNGGTVHGIWGRDLQKYCPAFEVNGGTFIMNGGEVISADTSEAINCGTDAALVLNGGTITYDSTQGYVINGEGTRPAVTMGDIVIRSKHRAEFIYYDTVNSEGWVRWLPDGYVLTEDADGAGYYYIVHG